MEDVADAAEADAETLRTQLLEVSAVASTARAESESLRAAAAAAAVPPEPGSIRAHLLTLANRRGPYAGAADDTSRSDRRHRSQERDLLSCVLAEVCTSLTSDDLASALFSAKLLDGLFYESLEGRAFKTKVIAAYAGAHAARWTIEEALAFMIDNNLSLGKMQRVRESFSLAYDTERRRFVHGRLAPVEGDEWLFDGVPEKFVMVLDPVPPRTALVKAWAAFRKKLPIPTNDDGSVATLPFIATVSTLIEENIRLNMLDEGVGSIEKPGYINVASDAFPVENTSISHTAVGVVTRDDISNQSPTQLAPIQAGRYKETNVQYHRQWGDSGLRADINETLRLGYIPLSNGVKWYCTLMFCLDKKGAEAFLGKGQCSPYSLNSWAERLEVPWDPDDPPADINAMMKLLIGEHGILTNFPLSHNMLRTIAHVPLEGEELPRPCALCDPDAPPCKPYATVAEREERVAAVQRMRDDTSEVGKKQYAAARSAYRGKHGDVNEHEFPVVNVGTDRFPPEFLHYYLINAPKQMTKNTCLRHLSKHTLERVTAFLTGMGYKLDVSKGGKISGWFKGADWQTMLLGGEQCPGGAPAWWSQLVWCIGEWELEHRNRAAPDPPPWHTNQSRVPADLESAMKARYGAELAKNLLQMLEGHDALLALTKIACEPTPDQAAMDDVAYRHGLAGATQLWTFAPRPFVTSPPPPPAACTCMAVFKESADESSWTNIWNVILAAGTWYIKKYAPPATLPGTRAPLPPVPSPSHYSASARAIGTATSASSPRPSWRRWAGTRSRSAARASTGRRRWAPSSRRRSCGERRTASRAPTARTCRRRRTGRATPARVPSSCCGGCTASTCRTSRRASSRRRASPSWAASSASCRSPRRRQTSGRGSPMASCTAAWASTGPCSWGAWPSARSTVSTARAP